MHPHRSRKLRVIDALAETESHAKMVRENLIENFLIEAAMEIDEGDI